MQLLISHLLLVLLMFVMMITAAINFSLLSGSIDRILRNNYDSVRAAQQMKETLERQDSAASFVQAGEIDLGKKQFEANVPLFESAYNSEAHNITEPGEQELADFIGQEYPRYRAAVRDLLYRSPNLSKVQAHDIYFQSLKPSFEKMKDHAQQILELNQRAIQNASDRAHKQAKDATTTAYLVTAGSFLLAMSFSLRMISSQLAPLRSLARQAEQIGAGHWNQSIQLNRNDEIGVLAESLNLMADKLRESRRLEEERLHRAERMSDAALENLYDPVIVTDAAGAVVHWNQAAAGLFGPRDQEVGRPIGEAINNRSITEAVNRAIHQERVSAAEDEAGFVAIPIGESHRTYRIRASPMRDNTVLLGAVVVLEDITHLRELDRLKTEFIGVASHELRTPVTSLLLSIELMQEGAVGALTPGQAQIVAAQKDDLTRLDRMMRDLLDLTRLEAGVTPPRFELVTAADLVNPSIRVVKAAAAAKGVELNVLIAQGMPALPVDKAQITRVLVNLLNNGIRHTPAGGSITISVHIEPGDDANATDGVMMFLVKDTGSGIPKEFQARIFERFVQVPGATRGGAGLGLSIARNIVNAHDGDIRVESEPGKGSLFILTLPLTREPHARFQNERRA